jgi:hypothetical protein
MPRIAAALCVKVSFHIGDAAMRGSSKSNSWEPLRLYGGNSIRVAIALAFTATFIMRGAAQDFMAPSGEPAEAFPKPARPVADIVSPIWHSEKERDAAGERISCDLRGAV